MSRILSVRTAFPPHRHDQATLTRAVADLAGLDPGRQALVDRLHSHAGVDRRHTVLPLADYADLGGVGPANDRYVEEATRLGREALQRALDAAGLTGADVDLLLVTSVTGVAVPSIDARLIPLLGLRPDVKRVPVFGLGCVAGAAGLSRVHDYLAGRPGHTAALLAVELCSLTWPAQDLSVADLVVCGLFGDGAAALVATGDGPAATTGTPRVIATRSHVYPGSHDTLGWRLASTGFRIVLAADLADVVAAEIGASLTGFLADHDLTVDDVTTWICHPGGPRVLDAVEQALKLPDDALATSRRCLAQAGNLSSASVLHILAETQATDPPAPGSIGVMIGLGPGVSAELLLLQW